MKYTFYKDYNRDGNRQNQDQDKASEAFASRTKFKIQKSNQD